MIRRLAIPAALALTLGACASYDSGYYGGGRDGYYRRDSYSAGAGYYASGQDGYGDYYYDNPQVIANEPYGPYWGGYYDYGYQPFGYGFGLGYSPYSDGFGYSSGFGPGWGGYSYGYYNPWYGYDYRDHDEDNDPDDRRGSGHAALITPTPGQIRLQGANMPRANLQTHSWAQRWSVAPAQREAYRPPARLPEAQRAGRSFAPREYSGYAPVSRQQAPHRHSDTDRSGR